MEIYQQTFPAISLRKPVVSLPQPTNMLSHKIPAITTSQVSKNTIVPIPQVPKSPIVPIPQVPKSPIVPIPQVSKSPIVPIPQVPKSPGITIPQVPKSPGITIPQVPKSPGITIPQVPKSLTVSVPQVPLPQITTGITPRNMIVPKPVLTPIIPKTPELELIKDTRQVNIPIVSPEAKARCEPCRKKKVCTVNRRLSEDSKNWRNLWITKANVPIDRQDIINEFSYFKNCNTITVYRGLSFSSINDRNILPYLPLYVGKEFLLEINNLSSWTTNVRVAKNFGSNEFSVEGVGFTLSMMVNPNDVFTDFNLMEDYRDLYRKENEVIVMPGTYRVRIFDIFERKI